MWVTNTVLLHGPDALTRLSFSYPTQLARSRKASTFSRFFRYPPRKKWLTALQTKKIDEDHEISPVPPALPSDEKMEKLSVDVGWLSAFPHVSVASMANFLFGYHIGVMNGPIVSIARELGFEGNSILEGLVVSIFIAGAFIGSIASGPLLDKLGCRRTFQIVTIPLILGALVSAQAHSLDEILCGRFLVGLGIGVNTVLVPIYISEVAPTKYRGSLGTLCQIGTCLGIIFSLLLGIPAEADPHWWRTMLYVASMPGFLLAVGMQFAVESPRWLCKVGRLGDAKVVIRNIWGESEVGKAVEDFQLVMKNNGSDLDSSWLELLDKPHSQVAFIGGSLFLLQQFAGINGVLYFSSLTFQNVGITSGALASLYVGVTNFAGALCASYLIDKQGRKKLLIGSYLGMAVSMFLTVYSVGFPLDEDLSQSLSILGTLMYIFSFAIGAGPVTGLIIPELSSNRTRGKIMGFSFSVHWVCNFLVGLFFLDLVEKFGVGPVYAGFGSVSLLAAAFSHLFTVETKGRSLEEIELSLNSPDDLS
ncbi:putative plastidic glucose transporter 1 [Cardamine amara subsp. amara]|uniref:Plastidic glucose transporter 1 n=1 Tax=Cardamine amara subsp. amara TaxID=228776 RepID=A0ABD1B1Q6_CARAN